MTRPRATRRTVLAGAAGAALAVGWPAALRAGALGAFTFADLVTDDVPQARSFYGGLFGWTFDRDDAGRGAASILAGGNEIGLLVDAADVAANGARPRWLPVIGVADMPGAISRAEAAGGTLVAGPTTDPKGHLNAVVRDPVGAFVTLYQGPLPPPAGFALDRWWWFDLFTNQPDAALAFYRDLGGLGAKALPAGQGHSSRLLYNDGKPVAGVVQVNPDGVGPTWVPYVGVASIADATAKAKSLGGRAVAESADAAVVVDPAGATIGLHARMGGSA